MDIPVRAVFTIPLRGNFISNCVNPIQTKVDNPPYGV